MRTMPIPCPRMRRGPRMPAARHVSIVRNVRSTKRSEATALLRPVHRIARTVVPTHRTRTPAAVATRIAPVRAMKMTRARPTVQVPVLLATVTAMAPVPAAKAAIAPMSRRAL